MNRCFLRLLIITALLAAGGARAHIPENYSSVHFNLGAPDFGSVPRRGILPNEYNTRAIGGYGQDFPLGGAGPELSQERDEHQAAARLKLRARFYHEAWRAEARGRWSAAAETYRKMAARLGWTGAVRDRVEVFERVAPVPHPLSRAFVAALQRYLGALAAAEDNRGDTAVKALATVRDDAAAGFLRAHAEYQIACEAYRDKRYGEAIQGFRHLLASAPSGPKREAALIMMMRAALLPKEKAVQDVAAGHEALNAYHREFPRGRLAAVATGLAGRLAYLEGRYGDAVGCFFQVGDTESVQTIKKQWPVAKRGAIRVRLLEAYLHELARASDYAAFQRAVSRIYWVHQSMTANDAFAFSQRLLSDTSLASPYLYYRLYHDVDHYDEERTTKDMRAMAQLAGRIVQRHPRVTLPEEVRLRIAEVEYQNRAYRRALDWAQSCYRQRPTDRALFVRGATLEKLGRTHDALTKFEELMRRFPASPLRLGAREELAILYEATGDLGRALDQYFALGYQADIAWLLDARMPIPQIEAYRRTHRGDNVHGMGDMDGYEVRSMRGSNGQRPRYRERDLVLYSLGIRYMREEKWPEAARALRMVPREAYRLFSDGRAKWEDMASPDPLTGIRELQRRHEAIGRARTSSERAAAMYEYGQYYYGRGLLLLYNPALWQGSREVAFQFWWNKKHANHADNLAMYDHMYRHEAYARAFRIFREAGTRYPNSPTAPKALYSAACAAQKLAYLNSWWEEHGEQEHLAKEATRLMRRMVRLYPKHQLATAARKYAEVFAGRIPREVASTPPLRIAR